MKVNIESMDFRNYSSLEDYAVQKINKSIARYPFVTTANVYFEESDNQKNSKLAKIQLHVKNDILFADALGNRFDAAFDNALQKIKRQVIKYKSKKFGK